MINLMRTRSTPDCRIACIAFVLCLIVRTAFASPVYGTYYNERYSFSIVYPSQILVPGRPPDNGDGRQFTSKNGEIVLTASGRLNIFEDSIATLYSNDKSDADPHPGNFKVTYEVLRSTWYAYSGYANGKVYYEKAFLTKGATPDTAVIHTMIFVYPKSQSPYFDPIVAEMSHSFHACSSPEGATLVG